MTEESPYNAAQAQLAIACDTLIDQIFLRHPANPHRGLAITITAPHPKAGVTYITQMLADRLGKAAACVDAISLYEGGDLPLPQKSMAAISTRNRLTRRSDVLEELRREFPYILIDCPSLKNPQHAIGLAPLVDGVVLVVEANHTQKRQILYSERTILSAGGSIVGHILNKRTYAIPSWLFSRLEVMGI